MSSEAADFPLSRRGRGASWHKLVAILAWVGATAAAGPALAQRNDPSDDPRRGDVPNEASESSADAVGDAGSDGASGPDPGARQPDAADDGRALAAPAPEPSAGEGVAANEGGAPPESDATAGGDTIVEGQPASSDRSSPPASHGAADPPTSGTADGTASARSGWGDPDAAPPVATGISDPAAEPERPRHWRMARRTIDRPLTLPQGVLRFDSTLAGSVYGRFYFTAGFGLAAGLFDELELGANPVAVTLSPLPRMNDPSIYARVRPFAGEVQLAFRAEVTVPTNVLEAQMGLAAELAWTANEWLRIDTGLDYQLLFSQPLHQRVGIPVTATFQTESPNAFALTTGVYVFNDFDDVDVPLLAAWIFAWRGYQGPLGETRIEGGVVDLGNAEQSWLIRARMTFFAYL